MVLEKAASAADPDADNSTKGAKLIDNKLFSSCCQNSVVVVGMKLGISLYRRILACMAWTPWALVERQPDAFRRCRNTDGNEPFLL